MTDLQIALVMGAIATTFIICSGFVQYAMIGEINGRLPENERISYLGFHLGKLIRIWREYRRLYPTGRLHIHAAVLAVVGWVFGICSGWKLGLFS